jgi:NADP-dependent 3-hydroxy acid dehydrogenase YdfG
MDLKGSACIVTGASAGLGVAFSEALVAKGARVAGLARRKDRLDAIRKRLGDAFLPVVCDVRDSAAVKRAVGEALAAFGRIDVLINNAGLGRFGPIEKVDEATWRELIDTNVTGVFLCTKEVVPVMKRQGRGDIVIISSVAGLIGNPELSAYNTTKFAVRGLGEALFKELREFGIKVSTVFPGSVATEFSHSGASASYKMSAAEVAEAVVFILERSENFLVSDIVLRPLKPKG